MTAPRLDATTLAARMNARPLGPDTDGGEWSVYVPGAMVEQCEACGCHLLGDAVVSAGNTLLFLCLPCALADCEWAENATNREAIDSHTTKGA